MEVITSCPDVRCMLLCPTRFWVLSVDQWLPWRLSVKESACQCRRCRFDPLGGEDSLEEEMATYSSILAKIIPWTEEPEGYSPWGCKRVRHNWACMHVDKVCAMPACLQQEKAWDMVENNPKKIRLIKQNHFLWISFSSQFSLGYWSPILHNLSASSLLFKERQEVHCCCCCC